MGRKEAFNSLGSSSAVHFSEQLLELSNTSKNNSTLKINDSYFPENDLMNITNYGDHIELFSKKPTPSRSLLFKNKSYYLKNIRVYLPSVNQYYGSKPISDFTSDIQGALKSIAGDKTIYGEIILENISDESGQPPLLICIPIQGVSNSKNTPTYILDEIAAKLPDTVLNRPNTLFNGKESQIGGNDLLNKITKLKQLKNSPFLLIKKDGIYEKFQGKECVMILFDPTKTDDLPKISSNYYDHIVGNDATGKRTLAKQNHNIVDYLNKTVGTYIQKSKEGFASMFRAPIREGLEASKEDEIYIDCQPVDQTEESILVDTPTDINIPNEIPDWYKKFLKADGTIDWKKVLNNPYIGYIIGIIAVFIVMSIYQSGWIDSVVLGNWSSKAPADMPKPQGSSVSAVKE